MIKALATYKSLQESSPSLNHSQIKCDICGSKDIVDTREGYVCRDCGIVLEIQKLQHDRPYNEDLIQYAKGIGTTQIGTKRERGMFPDSRKLHRLNKQNIIIENDKKVLKDAEAEISRIFTCLDLAGYNSIKKMVLEKFKIAREKLRPRSKYRNVEKLCTVIAYTCLKLRNVSVNPYKLIEASNLSKKEFNDFLLQVQRYLSEYVNRNRQKYVLQRVLEIFEHFDLGMPFYFLAKKILHKLWDGIKNTTDNAIAGLISSISALCSCKDKVSVSAICNRLGIRMSTVQAQVKKKIFERFKVNGFISLIKSSDMLVRIMEKLGLLEGSESEETPEVVSDGHVEIVLGNATQVFNVNNVDYYYFAIRGEQATPIIITLKINSSPLELEPETRPEVQSSSLLDFELYKFYRSRGPPPVGT